MTEMTHDPLPAGEQLVYLKPGGGCPVCRGSEYTVAVGVPIRMTRSVEPGPGGLWEVHIHFDWCPEWTGIKPDLPCPRCGAPVHEWSPTESLMGVGYQLIDVELAPCGHRLEKHGGDDVDGFVTQARELQFRHRQAEADAVLASHMDLLAAARAAGAGPLVEAYEDAVRRSSTNAPGLLQALRVQMTMPCRCVARDAKQD